MENVGNQADPLPENRYLGIQEVETRIVLMTLTDLRRFVNDPPRGIPDEELRFLLGRAYLKLTGALLSRAAKEGVGCIRVEAKGLSQVLV